MIYCIAFSDFVAFLVGIGFAPLARTERTIAYLRTSDGVVLTVRAPNQHGDITEQAALAACDSAGIEPAAFDVHWCD